MTISELKERLDAYPDDWTVYMRCEEWPFLTPVKDIYEGINEYKFSIIIDDWEMSE